MDSAKRSCDILLNNFQIKKKRYRVLLNFDHIVWERWDAKCKSKEANEKVPPPKKETEFEREHLSNKASYGNNTNVVSINEIIRVCKGDTKSASLRVQAQPSDFNNLPDLGIDTTSYHSSNLTSSAPPTTTATTATTIPAITPTAQYLTIHYAERIVKSPTDCNRWHIRSVTLFNTDPYIVAQWHSLLTQKWLENPQRMYVRRLLVFINPYGGRKEGLQTYERYCKPIFQLAGIDASCVISQRANQIRDIIMSHDLTPYDAVCCVGGDGTAAEVINGLIFRAMHDRGLDMRRPAYIPKPSLPIGIIPAGSTDTVAYSVHGTADARTAAIHLILGQRRGCDICSVCNRQGIIRFCASVFSYGYLGDVAARSEKYRWMGTKRYEYTGVKAFLGNRGYKAELRLLESEEDNEAEQAHTSRSTLALDSVCYANCQRCSSVISKCETQEKFEGSKGGRDISNEALLQSAQANTTSNWTLCTEKSSECDFSAEDNNIADSNGGMNDAVEKVSYATPNATSEQLSGVMEDAKDMTNCDKNLENDFAEKSTQIKAILRCDIDGKIREEERRNRTIVAPDAATIASRNSFSFCSTNSTMNNNPGNDFNNEMPIATSNRSSSDRWKVIRGSFFMISCANITCACARSPNGIAPYNHLGDGHLDVILVRKTNIINNLRFAMNTMGRDGDIRNLPFVEVYRTRRLEFRAKFERPENDEALRASTQPIAEAFTDDVADKLVSSWNCDGEVVHDLDVTMISHCQLIDVFMRGPYSYTKPNNENKHSCALCCYP